MAARKYGLALVQFREVLVQDPEFDRAWYNQGLALMRLGQTEEAIESLERSLENYQSSSASDSESDSDSDTSFAGDKRSDDGSF